MLEALRRASVGRILYASGSGVYGDIGEIEADEDRGPLIPISTYGASKLAGEALISAYCFMFGLVGRVFRFGNVVGPLQTHGVGLDFVRALLARPDAAADPRRRLAEQVVRPRRRRGRGDARRERDASGPYGAYNVATGDYITVTEIADLAVEVVGLDPGSVRYEYTGGDRGWKGDVPSCGSRSSACAGSAGRRPAPRGRRSASRWSALAEAIRAGRL